LARGKKILQFSINFDVDSEEFNQLLQIGFLKLAGKISFQPSPPPEGPPLRPHTSIFVITVQPHVSLPHEIPTNYGWNDVVSPPQVQSHDDPQCHFHYLILHLRGTQKHQ